MESRLKYKINYEWHIKENLRMDVLRKKFCCEKKLNFDNVRFLLDGERIKDDDTPMSLGLLNGDIIEVGNVIQARTGSTSRRTLNLMSTEKLERSNRWLDLFMLRCIFC